MIQLPHEHENHEQTQKVLELMPSVEDFEQTAILFQQLSDGTRLRIFWILLHTEECGVNLAAMIGMSPAAVSHHLKTLKMHGLITGTRRGKEVYYRLANSEMADFAHRMLDRYFELDCLDLTYPYNE